MKKAFPELTTPRLVLRELRMRDVPRLDEFLRDEEVTRYIDWGPIKHKRKFINGMRNAFRAGREIRWGICEKESGALMGVIDIYISRRNRSAMAGFWLGKEYWNRGYTTEAFQAVLGHCFNEMQLNRVYAEHYRGNEASGRVQMKCGLRHEGTQRQQCYKDGRYLDTLLYAILKEDFEGQKPWTP